VIHLALRQKDSLETHGNGAGSCVPAELLEKTDGGQN
jgi:hypothetical protein